MTAHDDTVTQLERRVSELEAAVVFLARAITVDSLIEGFGLNGIRRGFPLAVNLPSGSRPDQVRTHA